MKKIAIITGASSGMGKVFAETINTYDTFDEVWVIARRLDRLESLLTTLLAIRQAVKENPHDGF